MKKTYLHINIKDYPPLENDEKGSIGKMTTGCDNWVQIHCQMGSLCMSIVCTKLGPNLNVDLFGFIIKSTLVTIMCKK